MIFLKKDDVVEFNPILHTDEIYLQEMPSIGSIGKVLSVSIDKSFLMVWGTVLPICEVEFPEGIKVIYAEDLKLVK